VAVTGGVVPTAVIGILNITVWVPVLATEILLLLVSFNVAATPSPAEPAFGMPQL